MSHALLLVQFYNLHLQRDKYSSAPASLRTQIKYLLVEIGNR